MAVKNPVQTGKYTKFLMYLIVVVLINIAGVTLFFRMDLTSDKVYSLSKASSNVVATLSEPLTVKVFFNSNLPAPYNNIERYLHDLLEEYSMAGGKYFNYQFYRMSGEENEESAGNRQVAENYGISPVQIQNIEQDEVKFQKAYMGLALIHGDIIESIPTITSTDGLEYKITTSIRKMNNKISALLRLKDKISVKLFLSSSLKIVGPYMNISGLVALPDQIEATVQRLNNKNFNKLEFSYHDPSADLTAGEEAEKQGLLSLNWDEFKDRRGRTVAADKGIAGLIVQHGEQKENIELIEVIRLPIFGTQYQMADLEEIEQSIAETVELVININEKIGYLADHGTHSIESLPPMFGQPQQQESLSNLNTLLSEGYSIKQVNLKEEGIPDGISTLVVAGPNEQFSEYELYQIDQFLMKGNSLALFMDSFKEVKPQSQQSMVPQFQRSYWMPVDTGLEKLLTHYGLNIKKSIVLDKNSFKQRMPSQLGGGERTIYFAPIIKSEMINKDAAYLNNIKGLVMLSASPVEADTQKTGGDALRATRLFSSSDESWEMTGRINLDPRAIQPPAGDDKFGSMPMAYMLEGSFASYFEGKAIPEKEEKAADTAATGGEDSPSESTVSGVDMSEIKSRDVIIDRSKKARIFLLGTSEVLKNNVVDDEGKTPNSQFVLNIIDYLNGREEIASMRSKTQRFNPLQEIAPAARTAIKTANIGGIPILVIAAGIVVWARRSARKRTIQKIFS